MAPRGGLVEVYKQTSLRTILYAAAMSILALKPKLNRHHHVQPPLNKPALQFIAPFFDHDILIA
jgi:hypothetical protein